MKPLFPLFSKGHLKASILWLVFLFLSSPYAIGQYCVDGDYCPNPANDAGGTGNGCFAGIDDEYASALSVVVDPSAAATCEINEAFGDIAMDENGSIRLYLGLSIGNAGQGTFRLYFNTDCDSTTGQINAAKNFGNTVCSQMTLDTSTCVDVGGAEIMLLFTANGSSEGFYEWDTMSQAMVINNSLTDSIQLANGDLGGCSNSDGEFVEASFPLPGLFDFCSDDGCGSIELTTSLTNSGGSPNSNFCEGIDFSLLLPGNNPPTAVIDSLSPCLFSDQLVCLDGSNSIEVDDGDTLIYEWDLAFDGATFEADTTGEIVCLFFTPGTYTVGLRVTDRFGCMDTTDNINALIFTIMDPSNRVQCEITDSSGVSCPGDMSGSFDFRIILGSPLYSYEVLNSGGITVASGMAVDSNTVVVISGLIADTYTLLVEDDNTCTDTCVVEIISADTIAPSIICPPDDTLDCPTDTTTASTGVATSIDASAIITYRDSVVAGACNGSFILYRIWTATDTCNLDSSCIQIITVQDTTAPVILCPLDTTINCPGDTTTASTGVATATEECTASAIISYRDSVEAGGCAGDFVLFRIWTAADSCGNSTECIQTITVQDTTAPVILCPLDTTINCPGDTTTASTGVATATEECTASAIISYRDSVEAGGCAGDFVLFRIWTAADSCGNSTECIQTITVQDTTPPLITIPSDTILDCPADTNTASTGLATGVDECSAAVIITYTDEVTTGACNGAYTLLRIWTAADSCGNMAVDTQTVIIQDTTPPVIVCPPNLELSPSESSDTSMTGVAIATDECGLESILFRDSTVLGICPILDTIFRIWAAVDSCGNESACIQVIIRTEPLPQLAGLDSMDISCNSVLSYNLSNLLRNADTGGVWLQTMGMVSVDLSDPDSVDLSVVLITDTLKFIYTLSGTNICQIDTAEFTLIVNRMHSAGDDVSDTVCNTELAFDLTSLLSQAADTGGIYIQTGGTQVDISDPSSIDFNPVTTKDTLSFQYIVTSDFPCDSDSSIIDILVEIPSSAGLDTMTLACNTDTAFNLEALLRMADTGGMWIQSMGTVLDISDPTMVDLSVADTGGVLIFEYVVASAMPCLDDSARATVMVLIPLDAGEDNDTAIFCGAPLDLTSLLVGADIGGVWEQISGPTVDISDPSDVDISQVNVADSLLFLYIVGMQSCEQDTAAIQVRILVEGSLHCESSINASAGINCDFTLTSDELLASPIRGSYQIMIGGLMAIDTLVLGQEFVGQWTTFKVTNICTGVTCWGDIHFEDKLLPSPVCTDDTLACDDSSSPMDIGLPIDTSVMYNAVSIGGNCFTVTNWDACGPVELCWEDEDLDISCDSLFCSGIKRTWTVRDLDRPQMINTCMEFIYILLPEKSSISAPIDYLKPDNPISCSDLNRNMILDRNEDLWPPFHPVNNPTVGNEVLDREEGRLYGVSHEGSVEVSQGFTKPWIPLPEVTGYPLGTQCDDCLLFDWKDHILEGECSRYIERDWKIRSWCANHDLDTNFVQRIKIVDDEAPIVTSCPSGYTLYATGHECGVIGSLLVPEAHDDCDDPNYIKGVTITATSDKGQVVEEDGEYTLEIDLSAYTSGGEHSTEVQITWYLDDGCDNISECISTVTVVDNRPPVAACVSEENISLTDGYGKLFADRLDAGSNDNCNPVWFKVIREDDELVDDVKHGTSSPELTGGAYACDGANGDDDAATDLNGNQLGYEVYFDDYVKFCCEDEDTQVKILLRVYDWLPEKWQTGPVPRSAHFEGEELAGRYNDCWVNVSVEDKLGIMECPDHVTITCEDHLPESSAVTRTACGEKAAELINEIDQRNSCGIGRVIRVWRTTHDNGSYQECNQIITVVDIGDDYYIYDLECNDAQSENDSPVSARRVDGITWPCDVNYLPCELVQTYGLSAEDLVPELFIDGFNIPVVNKDLGACPDVFVGYDDLILVQDGDVCYKILRTWTVIDWCGEVVTPNTPGAFGGSFDRSGPGCAPSGSKPRWCYEQILKVLDHEKPVLDIDVDVTCDNINEDCGYLTSVSVEATDNCTGLAERTTWVLTFDASLGLDVIEGMGLEYIGYLPIGSHHIRFDGQDQCGNKAHGEATIEVTDCKQPVPICNVGIGTVVMPSNGEVTVWAVDVDGGTKDDCADLSFGIRRADTEDEFSASIVLTCEDLDSGSINMIFVEMQVIDGAGNRDFCTTFINVQDNEDVCGNGGPPISGTIVTRQGRAVVGHDVFLLDNQSQVLDQTQTNEQGQYGFYHTDGAKYIRPDKNDDAVNGLNTLDMLSIQMHFLDIQVFDIPHHILASDATHDDQVNVLDLLELQELILGLRSEFTNNRSWRYISNDDDVTVSTIFDIEEPKNINTLSIEQRTHIDFTAVKVGDVNDSSNPEGYQGSEVNSRSALEWVIQTQDIKYGDDDELRIPVRSSNFVDVSGYQYTLSYDQQELSFVAIESGALNIPKDRVNQSRSTSGMVSTNWYSPRAQTYDDDEVLFTLVMRGDKVSSLQISDAITSAESYQAGSVGGVTIDIRTSEAEIPFALYQNTPNPFDNTTLIGFDLPSRSEATLQVYDAGGKQIYLDVFMGEKGYNERTIQKSDINGVSGILYYRIETDEYSATKKMMVF